MVDVTLLPAATFSVAEIDPWSPETPLTPEGFSAPLPLASLAAAAVFPSSAGATVPFPSLRRPGSEVHDAIGYNAAARAFERPTNRAGGLEGGVTNGMPVVCRAAMKPIATLKRALPSTDVVTKEPFEAAFERIAPIAGQVLR